MPALSELYRLGGRSWLGDLSRDLLVSGELTRQITDRHVVGVTTNPSILQRALPHGQRAASGIFGTARCAAPTVGRRCARSWVPTCGDVCDLLRPVYGTTRGRDRRVSMQVDPRTAQDPHASLAEARALWWLVNCPNPGHQDPGGARGSTDGCGRLAEGISASVSLMLSLVAMPPSKTASSTAWNGGSPQARTT